jgi:hypothetical protein
MIRIVLTLLALGIILLGGVIVGLISLAAAS